MNTLRNTALMAFALLATALSAPDSARADADADADADA